jgi:hypothetical protein
VLSQDLEGQERAAAYFSKTLSKAGKNYGVTRREVMAIVKRVEYFCKHLMAERSSCELITLP